MEAVSMESSKINLRVGEEVVLVIYTKEIIVVTELIAHFYQL